MIASRTKVKSGEFASRGSVLAASIRSDMAIPSLSRQFIVRTTELAGGSSCDNAEVGPKSNIDAISRYTVVFIAYVLS